MCDGRNRAALPPVRTVINSSSESSDHRLQAGVKKSTCTAKAEAASSTIFTKVAAAGPHRAHRGAHHAAHTQWEWLSPRPDPHKHRVRLGHAKTRHPSDIDMRGKVLNAQAPGANTPQGQNTPAIARQALLRVVQVDHQVEWSSCVDWLASPCSVTGGCPGWR